LMHGVANRITGLLFLSGCVAVSGGTQGASPYAFDEPL
jgi:hypothetical protein